MAAGSEQGSVPSCCRISMVTWAVPLPPGDTTFRTRVISPWSRPVTPCLFAGIFSPLGGTVHTLRAGTHLFLHLSPQHPATGLAHSKGTVKIYERDGGKVPVFGLSLGEHSVSDRMPVSQVRETE